MNTLISVQDILYHIAEDLHQYSGADKNAAIEEFLFGNTIDLNATITADVEASELDYLERYGKGNTYYFRLRDYAHGNELTQQLFTVLTGEHTQLKVKASQLFEEGKQLYLFVHITTH